MRDAAREAAPEIARFYTSSRKFPRMVGRLPEGTRLWGGPYSFAQLGAAAAVLAVTLAARVVWSTGSIVIDLLIAAGCAWGAAFAARVLPTTRLNPAVVLASALACAFGPRLGTYRGRAVRDRARSQGRPGMRMHGRAHPIPSSKPSDRAGAAA